MDVAEKVPILPNEFNSESGPSENDAKSAHSRPEIAPNDTQGAPNIAPRPRGEGARRAGEGNAQNADDVGLLSAEPSVQSVASSPGEGLPADKLKAPKKRGPKTAEGRARSSRNSLKHGIRSPHPFIIEGLESPEEWEEFKLGIIESWQPVGMQELELAINVAWDHWKLRRCRLNENAQLSKQVDETEEELQQEDASEDGLPDGAPLPALDPERLVHHQHLKVIPIAGRWIACSATKLKCERRSIKT
jgi:hypothetical protein